jgi:hypothetical protein
MSLQTYIAHCGACGARTVFHVDSYGCYFVCVECGCMTEPRLTAAEADDDAVWVPVKTVTKERG